LSNPGKIHGVSRIPSNRSVRIGSRSSTEMLWNAFEKNASPGMILRPPGIIYYLNEAGARLLGIQRVPFCRQPLESFIPLEYRQEASDWLNAIARGQSAPSIHLPVGSKKNIWQFHGRCIYIRNRKRLFLSATPDPSEPTAEQQGLLSLASHEIRNGLNSLLGMLELAKEESKDRDELLQLALNSGMQLNHLLSSILNLARIEAGYVSNAEPGLLRAFLIEIAEPLRREARTKDIHFDLWLDPALPERAVLRYAALRQVLLNLISNAIKYTEKGMVQCRVTLNGDADAGFALSFEIIDTGSGIPEESQSLVFRRFYRVPNVEDSGIAGSGLGLSIVRDLVQSMGGQISLKSKEGQGSEFAFWIPVALDSDSFTF